MPGSYTLYGEGLSNIGICIKIIEQEIDSDCHNLDIASVIWLYLVD